MNTAFKTIILAALYTVISVAAFAQSPSGFNYQAVMRNSSGTLLASTNVTVKLSIINGTPTGNIILYSETRPVTTTAQGVINIQVGSAGATTTTGDLTTINWLDSNKYMKVEVDPAGGSSFTDFGTTQLMSVPYAAHATQSAGIMTFGAGTNNPSKMVIQHSPAYPTWGLQYSDIGDNFNFLAGGTNVMQVSLGTQNVNIGSSAAGTGKLNITSTVAATPALTVEGAIKATGTNKFAFVQSKTATNGYGSNGMTVDHPLCNGDPNAILMVIQNLYASSPIAYENSPLGVYYDTISAKWIIYTQNSTAIPTGIAFNIIVIK
ncbi:MAG: hypothetical protein JST82_02545 [Bacteroidetes bacterium]|nr:hypothetical protein [Bacteroidota bacterium]